MNERAAFCRRWAVAVFLALGVPVALDAYTDAPGVGGRIFVAGMLVFHVLVVSSAPRAGVRRIVVEAIGFAIAAVPAIEVVRGMVGAEPSRLAVVAGLLAGAHVVGRAIGAVPRRGRLASQALVAAVVAWPLVGYVGREAFQSDWGRGPILPLLATFESDPGATPEPVSLGEAAADASPRVLRDGVVRPGALIAVASDRRWRATWPGGSVLASGGAAFPWPSRGRVSFDGPGAPSAAALRPVARDVALLGVPAGVTLDAAARARVEARVARSVRWIALDEEDVASPAALSGLDAIVVDRPSTVARSAGVAAWVGLGGRAFSLVPPDDGAARGFGRIDAVDSSTIAARATIRPAAPPAPTRGDGPPRAWLLVAAALVAFAVSVAPMWGGIAALVVAGVLAFTAVGDAWWTVRAARVHWCQAPGSSDALGHRVDAVRPRGTRLARVTLAPGSALTTLPAQPRVDATTERVEVTWRGVGRVGSLVTTTLGGGIEVTGGAPPSIRVGWRDGVVLDPAYHVSPGGIVRLPPLHGGGSWPIRGERVHAAAIPEPIAEWIRRAPPPPAAGAIVGILRGAGTDGPYAAPLTGR